MVDNFGTMNPTASLPVHREPANYDEVSMEQSMLFSDRLKVVYCDNLLWHCNLALWWFFFDCSIYVKTLSAFNIVSHYCDITEEKYFF